MGDGGKRQDELIQSMFQFISTGNRRLDVMKMKTATPAKATLNMNRDSFRTDHEYLRTIL